MNAFSKTKVNLSAAHELQGEKEDDSGISSCSKQPSKRSISAKKIKRDFCFSVINLCILHQYLKKTGTPSFFFFLSFLPEGSHIFSVKGHYRWHAFPDQFCRIITKVHDHHKEELGQYAVLQNKVTEETEKLFSRKAHRNVKHHKEAFFKQNQVSLRG